MAEKQAEVIDRAYHSVTMDSVGYVVTNRDTGREVCVVRGDITDLMKTVQALEATELLKAVKQLGF